MVLLAEALLVQQFNAAVDDSHRSTKLVRNQPQELLPIATRQQVAGTVLARRDIPIGPLALVTSPVLASARSPEIHRPLQSVETDSKVGNGAFCHSAAYQLSAPDVEVEMDTTL